MWRHSDQCWTLEEEAEVSAGERPVRTNPARPTVLCECMNVCFLVDKVLLCPIFDVQTLNQVSTNPEDAKMFAAHNNPTKNRSTEFLPGECYS